MSIFYHVRNAEQKSDSTSISIATVRKAEPAAEVIRCTQDYVQCSYTRKSASSLTDLNTHYRTHVHMTQTQNVMHSHSSQVTHSSCRLGKMNGM